MHCQLSYTVPIVSSSSDRTVVCTVCSKVSTTIHVRKVTGFESWHAKYCTLSIKTHRLDNESSYYIWRQIIKTRKLSAGLHGNTVFGRPFLSDCVAKQHYSIWLDISVWLSPCLPQPPQRWALVCYFAFLRFCDFGAFMVRTSNL